MTIDRRTFLKAAVGAAGAALVDPAFAGAASAKRRPNVLLVMTDQQALSGVQGYGNPIVQTPSVARLAAEGVLCEDFYISAFPCTPARSVLMTGQWAHTNGIVINKVELPNEHPSLGHHFREAGYRTHYVGKWHLGGEVYRGVEVASGVLDGRVAVSRGPSGFVFEKAQGGLGEDGPNGGFKDTYIGGWNHYKQYLRDVGLGAYTRDQWVGAHQQRPSAPDDRHAYSQIPAEHHMSAFLAGSMENVIRNAAGTDTPWLGVLSFYGPHLPVAPPRPWHERYALGDVSLPANFDDSLAGKPPSQRADPVYVRPYWKQAQVRDYIRRYWGFCSYVDEQLGRVLSALDETGQMDDTVVVFTSDHGDMVGEHGMIYKLSACGYDALIRVPLIVRYPARLKAGARIEGFAEQVGLLRTLLDLAGIEPGDAAPIEGRSFAALLEGEGQPHENDVQVDMMNRCWTVRTARHKAVFHWANRQGAELYDLAADPGEITNLAGEAAQRAVLAALLERMDARLARSDHPYRARMVDAARASSGLSA